MIPKKSKELIKSTAQQLGISEELVDAVKSFYWKEVRKSISDLKYHSIFVENLGTFKVKPWKLPEILQKYNNYLNSIDATTFKRMEFKVDMEGRIEKIKILLELLNEESEKKQSVKDKRNV